MGPVMYKVHHLDKGKESQVYHLNLIKGCWEKMPGGKKVLTPCKVDTEVEEDDD